MTRLEHSSAAVIPGILSPTIDRLMVGIGQARLGRRMQQHPSVARIGQREPTPGRSSFRNHSGLCCGVRAARRACEHNDPRIAPER